MSSIILHIPKSPRNRAMPGAPLSNARKTAAAAPADMNPPVTQKMQSGSGDKHQLLAALGARVRDLRGQRGMTRKAVSVAAGVSERHLANLEYGDGNASILVLAQVAGALHCPLAELIGDVTTSSPEWLLIRELLEGRDDAALRRVRVAIADLLGTGGGKAAHPPLIALIGLRGAGKSTLGRMLADDLGFSFVELSGEIEKFAGCTVAEIQALYGVNAYRRYERRALEEAIQIYPEAVIASPGGLVSDPATFNQLLAHCTTVWLQAAPEDHMSRVAAQGDMRPMAASREAMADLKGILASRTPFYSKAQFTINTSAQGLAPAFQELRHTVRRALQLPD